MPIDPKAIAEEFIARVRAIKVTDFTSFTIIYFISDCETDEILPPIVQHVPSTYRDREKYPHVTIPPQNGSTGIEMIIRASIGRLGSDKTRIKTGPKQRRVARITRIEMEIHNAG